MQLLGRATDFGELWLSPWEGQQGWSHTRVLCEEEAAGLTDVFIQVEATPPV